MRARRATARDELARVPMLLQDRQYLLDDSQGVLLVRPTTYVEVRDGRLRSGPASDRIAVAPASGGTRRRARLLPPAGARRIRSYEVDEQLLDPDLTDVGRFEDDTFVQLHVFACAHATLALFEQLLGRDVRWAFPGAQLELVPWGGTDRNAYYERESASVTFCSYSTDEGRTVLLALSRDIVAHETAHAILDAVAPELYDACDPDSLTIHEAYGDIAAFLQTLLDEAMLFSAYALFDGDTDAFEALGRLGEEFGTDLRRDEGAAALRAASSDATFDTAARGRPVVDRWDPHEASAVVVGALFAAVRERAESSGRDFEAAVLQAARELARIAIPALHRLPAGEASLRDLTRALDNAARETAAGSWWTNAIVDRFVARGVADDPASLRAPPPAREPLVGWPGPAAEVVDANRELLAVPPDVSPLATLTEFHDRAWSKSPRRRVQLRVAWDVAESHDLGYGLAGEWLFRAGTTAIVEPDTGVPVSILTSGDGDDVFARRHEQLGRWADAGLLEEYARRSGDGLALTRDGRAQRVAGTARTLHLLGRTTTTKGART